MKVKVTESQLEQYLKECIVEMDDKIINEALTPTDKSDIKVMIKKEIKDFLDITRGSQFETKVKDWMDNPEHIVTDMVKYITEGLEAAKEELSKCQPSSCPSLA